MKNILSKLKPQQGISLIEILVAAIITAIISAAAIEVYITQHKSYIWQEQITEMNMNANAAMEELVKRINEAGKGIPTDVGSGMRYLFSSNTNPDTIRIISRDLGDSGYFGYEMFGGAGTATVFFCAAANDTGGPYTNPRFMDIEVGDKGLVVDYLNNYCDTFIVTDVHRIVGTDITHTATLAVANGSYVTKIEHYKLFLDNELAVNHCDTTYELIKGKLVMQVECTYDTVTSNLVMMTVNDPEAAIVASNITDLEFMYFMVNGDSSTTVSTNIPVDRIRITLTARTEKKVQGERYRYLTLEQVVKIKSDRSYRDIW